MRGLPYSGNMNLTSSYFMFLSSLFLLLTFQLSYSLSSMHPLCHADERSALLQFKESFIINNSTCRFFYDDYLPPVASWTLENSSCCSWDGVDCDKKSGHVIGLKLINSCLYGSINSSSSLFQLVHLQLLDLSYNNFNFSQIPSSIGNLSKLQYLRLSDSFFAGQIPSEISQLSKLSSLDLSCNSYPSSCSFFGLLSFDPSSKRLLELKRPHFESLVQNLTNLEELSLSLVNIPYPVPSLLANMSSLSFLILPSCGLLGELPTNIFQLPHAEFLHLVQNPGLTGNLPDFNRTSHLKYLNVMRTGMSGEIPASIGNLGSLEQLSLGFNNFSGLVPPSIGNLSKLTVMTLSGNSISGNLPSFANLNHLASLDLSSNGFAGPIPNLMNLTSLTLLNLESNKFQGPIPSSISGLKNLKYLDLSFNNLSGTMELDSLHVLKNLTTLGLAFNKLSLPGKINSSASFPNLTTLSLASCNLSEFPQYLQNLDKLMFLDLSFNNIHGLVPHWFLETSKETLLTLDLSHNFLTGFDQSPFVLPWSSLKFLKIDSNRIQGLLPLPPLSTVSYIISNNSLTGEIPPLICNQTLLHVLDLSKNNLSGQIPECLGNFSNFLSILNLGSNNFHGTIPRTWTHGCKLRMINLGQNKLKGLIPRSMSKCATLENLDLGHNQINDTFPFWLGTLPELKILILQSNKFHGAIWSPEFRTVFPKLHVIDLSYNGFVGNLPFEYFSSCNSMKITDEEHLAYLQADIGLESFDMSKPSMTASRPSMTARKYYEYSMTVTIKGLRTEYTRIIAIFALMDFSCNKFEGEVPESIGMLKGLFALNLSNNLLSGHIPSAMGNLTQLESLDLSLNKLSGEIPQQLAQLTFLSFINVSYNNFTGPIPRGNQFATFQNNSFEGNLGLCGNQLSRKCDGPKAFLPPLSASTDNQESGSSTEFDWIIVVIGYGSGFIIGVVIGHIVITRKHDWFLKNFGIWQPKTSKGKKIVDVLFSC